MLPALPASSFQLPHPILALCCPQVAVPLPDIRGRTEILEYYLGSKPVAKEVDRDLLARQTQGR
jgi:hypothetical protein